MTDVRIRPATSGDADRLTTVYHTAYRENRELGYPAKAESVTASELTAWIEQHRVFVAEVDDTTSRTGTHAGSDEPSAVVGAVRLEQTGPDRIKLSRLAVHDDWKGDGIGSRLLDHAESTARENGFESIWLTTPEDHPFLPAIYRDRGYEVTEPYPLEYRDYDEVLMEKSLQ